MLSEKDKNILNILAKTDMESKAVAMLLIALDTEEKQDRFLEWMEKHPKASKTEILSVITIISDPQE